MATPNRSGLIVQSTPENERTASAPFMNISVKDRVVAVNARTSSAIRWSGFVDRGRLLEVKIRAIREVLPDDSSRQPHSPEQSEPLLGESVQDHDRCRSREHADVEDGLSDESGLVAMGNRRHEVAADIAVDDVQAVDREREGDE